MSTWTIHTWYTKCQLVSTRHRYMVQKGQNFVHVVCERPLGGSQYPFLHGVLRYNLRLALIFVFYIGGLTHFMQGVSVLPFLALPHTQRSLELRTHVWFLVIFCAHLSRKYKLCKSHEAKRARFRHHRIFMMSKSSPFCLISK